MRSRIRPEVSKFRTNSGSGNGPDLLPDLSGDRPFRVQRMRRILIPDLYRTEPRITLKFSRIRPADVPDPYRRQAQECRMYGLFQGFKKKRFCCLKRILLLYGTLSQNRTEKGNGSAVVCCRDPFPFRFLLFCFRLACFSLLPGTGSCRGWSRSRPSSAVRRAYPAQ